MDYYRYSEKIVDRKRNFYGLKKHPYKLWEEKSPVDYSWEHVTFEGYGYVLIGNIRYDFINERLYLLKK